MEMHPFGYYCNENILHANFRLQLLLTVFAAFTSSNLANVSKCSTMPLQMTAALYDRFPQFLLLLCSLFSPNCVPNSIQICII